MPWENEVEREEEHHSETAMVIITLSSGFFVFNYAKVLDKDGIERYTFAKDEKIYFEMDAKNTGDAGAPASFLVTDLDTDKVLWSPVTSLIPPGYRTGPVKSFTPVSMPDRDLYLSISVSP